MPGLPFYNGVHNLFQPNQFASASDPHPFAKVPQKTRKVSPAKLVVKFISIK